MCSICRWPIRFLSQWLKSPLQKWKMSLFLLHCFIHVCPITSVLLCGWRNELVSFTLLYWWVLSKPGSPWNKCHHTISIAHVVHHSSTGLLNFSIGVQQISSALQPRLLLAWPGLAWTGLYGASQASCLLYILRNATLMHCKIRNRLHAYYGMDSEYFGAERMSECLILYSLYTYCCRCIHDDPEEQTRAFRNSSQLFQPPNGRQTASY